MSWHSFILDVQSFREADCDTEHHLVVANTGERLSVNKRELQNFDVKRSNPKKLNDVGLTGQFCFFCFPGVTTHWVVSFTAQLLALASSFSRFLDHTHNDTPQSVGLLWTSYQSVAETSTWQYTTLTTDKHPCLRWDSDPRSQQASGRRPTP